MYNLVAKYRHQHFCSSFYFSTVRKGEKKEKANFAQIIKKSCMYYMSLSSKRYPKHST